MALIEQKFLVPGVYRVGKDEQGRDKYRELSADDLREYATGTNELLASGHGVAVLLEHAHPGSDEGAPKDLRDQKALQVKHGVGWLKGVKVGTDGAATHVLEITDPDAAGKIANGSIRFTSPEFRESWTDGTGRVFRKIFSHTALTHKPRNIDQSQFSEVLQFSLDDLEPEKMADEKDEKTEETTAEPPENPDLPNSGDVGKDQARMEAILAHLNTIGIGLPADTDNDNFQDRLLTALLTVEAQKAANAEEKSEEDEPEVREDTSIQSPLQFSLADASENKLENKLLAKLIRQEHEKTVAKLGAMVSANKITPAARDQLLAIDGALQFSSDGDYLPALTLPKIVDVLDSCLVEGQSLTQEQVSQFSAEEHPQGEQFRTGEQVTEAKVKETNEQMAKANPGMYRS